MKGSKMAGKYLFLAGWLAGLVLITGATANGLDEAHPKEKAKTQSESKIDLANRQIKANNWFGGVDKNGIPTMLEGDLFFGKKGADKAEEGYRFFEKHKQLFQMENPRSELKLQGVAKDEIEQTVIFDQVVNGVKVRYGEFALHFNLNAVLLTLNGQIDPEARTVDTNPAISEQQAVEIAFVKTDSIKIDWPENAKSTVKDATLLIARFDERLKLVWAISVIKGYQGWGFWIDAKTGEIIDWGSSTIEERHR